SESEGVEGPFCVSYVEATVGNRWRPFEVRPALGILKSREHFARSCVYQLHNRSAGKRYHSRNGSNSAKVTSHFGWFSFGGFSLGTRVSMITRTSSAWAVCLSFSSSFSHILFASRYCCVLSRRA